MHAKTLMGLLFLAVSVSPAIADDAEKGEQVFRKCRVCHQVGDSAKNTVGPQLNDIIGRHAGTIEGFNYSAAMKTAGEEGLVWNEENLMKYLKNPREFLPKNKMAFAGLKDDDDRKDVIAYLKKFSK